MKSVTVELFEAADGQRFSSKEKCFLYEVEPKFESAIGASIFSDEDAGYHNIHSVHL